VLALQTPLHDRDLLRGLASFYDFTAAVLLLPHNQAHFRYLPEHIVGDMIEFYAVAASPTLVIEASPPGAMVADNALSFALKFMAGDERFPNPHVRGKFAQFLMTFLPDRSELRLRDVDIVPPRHIFLSHPMALQKMVPALFELYVEIEFGERQFYSKFQTRHCIASIFKFLWQIPHYRERLLIASRDTPSFLKFTNVLCNDIIYLLEESLRLLSLIREDQTEMANPAAWQALQADERQRRERSFAQNEHNAKILMLLANSTIHMLFYFSDEENGGTVAPFVVPEVVDRMATMVDFFINRLAGPQVKEVKVQDPRKYHFEPGVLLTEIVGIFLHLSSSDAFLERVAHDQRSYDPQIFAHAGEILAHPKRKLMRARQLAQYDAALQKVAQFASNIHDTDVQLGDIPAEFLDPILATLMRDPVILPGSQQRIDREVIVRHLLNDRCDPFTRQPLTEDMLRPDLELRARIQAWVRERLATNAPPQ